ncbi:MAG TPA: type II secretion system protein [Coleofasciculaceae cyanobacterium]|jgi:Tfp pilus assembly protein PilW
MKNKEVYKLLKKNKLNLNSGFTLTELLVGLVMSIFVIGALGFGLMTVLGTTQSENSKVQARTENSRALDFISDEVRRARNIETDATGSGKTFNPSVETVVLVLNIPEISSTGKIVYYLKSNSGTNWKGPQVLYRWGPPLDAKGNYTTGAWGEQALIDGINNTTVATPCTSGGTVTPSTPATPTGFYACITGANTAQLFLTGQTKTASGVNNDSQTNDTQVVARARETLGNKTDTNNSVTWSFKDLGGKYGCQSGVADSNWNMQTNFGTNTTNLNADTTSWTQDVNKQPQPIAINTALPLVITATPTPFPSPFDPSNCNSRGNPGTGSLDLNPSSATVKVSHAIDFGNPITFNGDCDPSLVGCSSPRNQPRVKGDLNQTVQFFKKGYEIPTNYGGYDANNNGNLLDPGDQPSLGKFLYDQGMAIPVSGDPNSLTTTFKIPTSSSEIDSFLASTAASSLTSAQRNAFKLLGDDQRIIAFEVGQLYPDRNNDGSAITGNKNPGFDLQDNIFVVTSDVFKKKFAPSCFSDGKCNPSTGKPNPQ